GWSTFHHLADVILGHMELFGDFVHRRTVAQLLRQTAYLVIETIQLMLQLRRQAENLPMMRDCRQDRLSNPPTGIGDEAHAAGRIESRYRFDQSQLPFVDELVQRIS